MTTANDILDRAREVLGDKSKVRYPDAKLLLWINDALDLLLKAVPKLFVKRGSHTCTAGAAQTLINTRAAGIVDVIGALPCDRETLDAYLPTWQSANASAAVNWMPGDEGPKSFLLYPPAVNGVAITVRYVETPAELTAGTDALPVTDEWVGPLADYCVGMAESKDDEHINTARAQAFTAAFAAKIGIAPAPKKKEGA